MRINTALILCAGFGKRLNPITSNTPKPLLEIKNISMLERCINLIEKLGIQKILINTFYLKDQFYEFLHNKNFNLDIKIIEDGEHILDTGGGIQNMIKVSDENDFLIFNPDTVWSNNYKDEILKMEEMYFSKKLKNVDFTKSTLYINIDPTPSKDNISEVINVARKYFGNVIYNIPNEPNFAQAILWCFQQVKGEYFFHLEDDWILLREVNIHSMVHVLQLPNVSQCILNKKNINPKEIYEPAFIPSLFMTKIVKVYLQFMNNESNPKADTKAVSLITPATIVLNTNASTKADTIANSDSTGTTDRC